MIKDKIDYGILINQLNKASDAYYNSDSPIMSDEEFDLGMEELREFEKNTGIVFSNSPTQNVGAPVLTELKRIEITPKPMLSLEKCHTDKEVLSFLNGKENIAMMKLDGLSVRIKYKDGKIFSANTRGNGTVGTDITEHIKQFTNVPLTIPYKGEYIIDGEAIIKIKDFNNEFKNPRNASSGALNVLDTKLVKERKLSFIAWDVISGSEQDLLSERLTEASHYGFEVVFFITNTPKEGINITNEAIMGFKNSYPIDGVVWKYDDIAYGESLGATGHHFKNGIAWKPEVEVVESVLKSIDWTMGRSGILTPVAVFDPVDLDGSTVERASLHNISVMKATLGLLSVGQYVKVYKANMIIPQILKSENASQGIPIDIPETCPICGAPTAITKSADGVENLICTNPNCDGKLINRLDHFCGKKGLDIKGLSKATLEKLIEWGWVNNFSDIFELYTHQAEWENIQGFGAKSVQRILGAIEQAKTQPLQNFLTAIGIPLIGANVVKEICKYVKTYSEFRKLVDSHFNFMKWDTFGPEKCDSILKFDYTEADDVANYITFIEQEQPQITTDLNVVITGKLTQYKNRSALQKDIEAIGGKVSSSVSSKTSYLINNDIDSHSTKNIDAKRFGVSIISEQEFIEKFLTSIKK